MPSSRTCLLTSSTSTTFTVNYSQIQPLFQSTQLMSIMKLAEFFTFSSMSNLLQLNLSLWKNTLHISNKKHPMMLMRYKLMKKHLLSMEELIRKEFSSCTKSIIMINKTLLTKLIRQHSTKQGGKNCLPLEVYSTSLLVLSMGLKFLVLTISQCVNPQWIINGWQMGTNS